MKKQHRDSRLEIRSGSFICWKKADNTFKLSKGICGESDGFSDPMMENTSEKNKPAHGQLISVPHKDTIRLLEVYVKRSISLNDGKVEEKQNKRKDKWVTMSRKPRRSSSDPSHYLANESSYKETDVFEDCPPPNVAESVLEELEKSLKKAKKSKKQSFWKNLFSFLSPKTNNDKGDEPDGLAGNSNGSDSVTTCLNTTSVNQQKKSLRRKSLKRRFSRKRLSIRTVKDFDPSDITGVEAVISVEPTYSYYEKVSEELEKIVHEVKEETETLSDEELIRRITALTMEHGDAIDIKMKNNPILNGFFGQMTYSSFQKLVDAYVEKRVTPVANPPTVPPTAPELVKLAFTLDFTARIAGLSKQNVGHITCLGKNYLQNRFEYKQACSDHPWSDSEQEETTT
ncbi:hypothetical protein OJAV_G00045400 [Oryzias javanicus]|uniref:Apoptosis facilitator Bcl-2-like protein 14 n=1 Tax=Oryzias javanicus TaxID=123683 RepID=A0A3S2Q7S7_ORYJA|nr:hypothetical protein OJAV_G00045400 [Oryzias javanicus]